MLVSPIQINSSTPVDPDLFVSKMEQHWISTLKNATSEPLRELWRRMCQVFNEQIYNHESPLSKRLKVLQPPTGTGKSQGLAVYCSCLDECHHPGVLIVVRLKTQADEMASTINQLAGKAIAVARHGDAQVSPEDLSMTPIAIITHKAYENGLDAVARGEPQQSAWDLFHNFKDGTRKLIVIDEALDILQETKVDLEQARHLQAILSSKATSEDAEGLSVLNQFIAAYETLSSKHPEGQEMVVECDDLAKLDPTSLACLRASLKSKRLDRSLALKDDKQENARLIQHYEQVLKAIQSVIASWKIFALKGDHFYLSTAKLILPEDGCGAVILDATAKENVLYSLLPEKADLVQGLPSNTRRYGNVKLHVSKGHRVGKGYLRDHAKQEVASLITSLKTSGLQDRRVLVCCHKAVEPHLLQYQEAFQSLGVTHWGAIDGRNDWNDFDCVVIFGLPYRDDFHAPNLFFAAQGPQSNNWLRDNAEREFGNHKDIRLSIKVGTMASGLIQAINRVRCRRVIDAHGNCAPTDVYLVLPGDKTGDLLLKDIKGHMPGIKETQWHFTAARKMPKRSTHKEAVLAYASNMPIGKTALSDIAKELGFNPSATDFVQRKLKQEGDNLKDHLEQLGVTYRVDGKGRGRRAWLVKDAI